MKFYQKLIQFLLLMTLTLISILSTPKLGFSTETFSQKQPEPINHTSPVQGSWIFPTVQ